VGFVLAAPTCARNRTVKNIPALHFDEHFRRTANNGNIVHLQIEKIRRGIERAKLPVDFEWRRFRFRGKTLADYNLKNVAGANIFLGLANGGKISGLREI